MAEPADPAQIWPSLRARMRLPLIAAPMLRVSGPDLVVAACQAGVVGSFPTANARTPERLAEWLTDIDKRLDGTQAAPVCANLIIRQPHLSDHLAVLVEHRVDMVITSTGSPDSVVEPLHAVGAFVFADVASLRHAHRAVEAGADGLVLLAAGAGGHTGWMNPFAFVRAVREFFDGPIVLAGGVADGASLFAAQVLGCDLAYMGTRFIATRESMAGAGYKAMLVNSTADDVILTRAFTSLPTSILRPAIVASGIDASELDENITAEQARAMYGPDAEGFGPRRWSDLFSAGHAVTGVHDVPEVRELVDRITAQYAEAKEGLVAAVRSGRIG
ncbi:MULTISPECIES: NAD(P)H-dependent flavin oxidoreductase [unclassified Streptomyces]|uniref:NAD(P)H-dependent flavin oxidoreductase n=1 Tax=unclassified Streptomyces TaxID=2593676 RepID=UPI0036EF6B9A